MHMKWHKITENCGILKLSGKGLMDNHMENYNNGGPGGGSNNTGPGGNGGENNNQKPQRPSIMMILAYIW